MSWTPTYNDPNTFAMWLRAVKEQLDREGQVEIFPGAFLVASSKIEMTTALVPYGPTAMVLYEDKEEHGRVPAGLVEKAIDDRNFGRRR